MLFYGNDFYWIFFCILWYIGFIIVLVINIGRILNKIVDDKIKNYDKNDKLFKVLKWEIRV